MAKQTILITGGAGFIGSHLCEELLGQGYHVRVLDNLIPQVHGPTRLAPSYLNKSVELIVGDIRDANIVNRALTGADAVYHLVALVGVGQSMYQVPQYTNVNNVGTAVLLENLTKHKVQKLIVASSMSVYGEGLYKHRNGALVNGHSRPIEQLRRHQWEMLDENGDPLVAVDTPETKPPVLASIYALSKFDQEQMCLILGRAYGIPTVGLRFFNVYGPNQALSNPYTGVLAIFASRLMNAQRPMIFEDGNQMRDFVSVYDIAKACRLALETPAAADMIFNVGSGQAHTIRDIAVRAAKALDKDLEPEITGNYRFGDIRHCFPDITRARQVLGYSPSVDLNHGLVDFAKWLEEQTAQDRFAEMKSELTARGLVM